MLMSDYIIQKIEVGPGDVVLLQVSNEVDTDTAYHLWEEVKSVFPNNEVLIANKALLENISIFHIKDKNKYINEITFQNEKSLEFIIDEIMKGDLL